MKHFTRWFAATGMVLALAGCASKANFGILGPSTEYVSTLPNPWIVYNNGVWHASTNLNVWQQPGFGGATGDDVVINFQDTTSPYSGSSCLSFTFISQGAGENYGWAGFAFVPAVAPTTYTSTKTFTSCTFYARTNVPSCSYYSFSCMNSSTVAPCLTTTWQKVTITLAAGQTGNVSNSMFYASIANLPATWSPAPTIYLDDLTLQ